MKAVIKKLSWCLDIAILCNKPKGSISCNFKGIRVKIRGEVEFQRGPSAFEILVRCITNPLSHGFNEAARRFPSGFFRCGKKKGGKK